MASTKNEVPEFDTLEGYEIFKPVDTLRPSQRLRLTAKVLPMVDDSDEFTDENMTVLADMTEFLEDNGYIADLDAWTRFFSTHGIEGAITLATAYAGEATGAKQ
jgi:hypothetical protein